MVKTTEYSNWLQDCGIQFMAAGHKAEKLSGFLRVNIEAHIGRNRDLDNLLKCALDALQTWGAIADDKYVDIITMRRVDNPERVPKDEMLLQWEKF